jgi:hypothetical protein
LIVAVHQPQYLPWLGYFDKIRRADIFSYLDCVQYKKNDWQNRNRIKTSQGWQWLTVPVRFQFPEKICEVKINQTVKWHKKHLQALVTNYRRAPLRTQVHGGRGFPGVAHQPPIFAPGDEGQTFFDHELSIWP